MLSLREWQKWVSSTDVPFRAFSSRYMLSATAAKLPSKLKSVALKY